VEFGRFYVQGGHLGVGNDNAFGVLASVEFIAHGEAGFGTVVRGSEIPNRLWASEIVIDLLALPSSGAATR
jgi:hypothetical protein